MKKVINFKYAGMITLLALLIFSVTAWNQSAPSQPTQKDTVPKTREKKIRDLDEALLEMDKATLELNKTDWQKIDHEIKESLKNINPDKIKAEVEKAMKEIDFDKIKIDIEKAMKEVDAAKIKLEIDASLAKVDMEKIKLELEKVKEIDFSKMEIELKKIKPELEKSLADAKISIEKAKEELKEYKSFVDGLEKDGLINKKAPYKIEHKDGVLKINDKTQPADVYNKYRTFLEKHKNFTLKKDADDFNIDID
jgi:copper chaperone CopZ